MHRQEQHMSGLFDDEAQKSIAFDALNAPLTRGVRRNTVMDDVLRAQAKVASAAPQQGPVERLVAQQTPPPVVAKKSPSSPTTPEDLQRFMQAKAYWKIGVGAVLGIHRFEDYLETIPHVQGLKPPMPRFSKLVLEEVRVPVRELCALAKFMFPGTTTYVDLASPSLFLVPKPKWIWIDDGRRRPDESAFNAQWDFTGREVGMTLLQGVCTAIQKPGTLVDNDRVDGYGMILSGSVDAEDEEYVSCIFRDGGTVKIHPAKDTWGSPKFGVGSTIG